MRNYTMIFCVFLLGCGGADNAINPTTNGIAPYNTLLDQSSATPSAISGQEFNPTQKTVRSGTGSLDHKANQITFLDLTGRLNSSRSAVVLDSGGNASLETGTTSFVARYNAQPRGKDSVFGVIGIPTQSGDLPKSGTATYTGTGTAKFVIVDGVAAYDLVGNTGATVDFVNRNVDVVFNGLSGTRSTGLGAPTNVTSVAEIRIPNASLLNGSFSGGTVQLNSNQLAAGLSTTAITSLSGGLFGPSADEIGGVLQVDDTVGGGTIFLQGSFTAD